MILVADYDVTEGPESEKIEIDIGYLLSFKINIALQNCGEKVNV